MAFLVLEGLDGSGKSTLLGLLKEFLERASLDVVVTREPGGTPLAEKIRDLLLDNGEEVPYPRTEVLLYQASRAQHVEGVLRPALRRGSWVLCDRFFASTVAFQVFGRSLDRSEIDGLNAYATGGLTPDLTIFLDLPVERSMERVQGRPKDRMESENQDFHERVRQGYLAQARENPQSWLVVSSEKSPEELLNVVVNELRTRGWLKS